MCIKRTISKLCGHIVDSNLDCGTTGCREEQIWSTYTHCENCRKYLAPYTLSAHSEETNLRIFGAISRFIKGRDEARDAKDYAAEERERITRQEASFAFAGNLGRFNPRFNPRLPGHETYEERARLRRFIELVETARYNKSLEILGREDERRREVYERWCRLPEVDAELTRLEEEMRTNKEQRLLEEYERLQDLGRMYSEEFQEAFKKQTKERKGVIARLLGLPLDDSCLDRLLPHAWPGEYPSDYGVDYEHMKVRAIAAKAGKEAAKIAADRQVLQDAKEKAALIVGMGHIAKAFKRIQAAVENQLPDGVRIAKKRSLPRDRDILFHDLPPEEENPPAEGNRFYGNRRQSRFPNYFKAEEPATRHVRIMDTVNGPAQKKLKLTNEPVAGAQGSAAASNGVLGGWRRRPLYLTNRETPYEFSPSRERPGTLAFHFTPKGLDGRDELGSEDGFTCSLDTSGSYLDLEEILRR